MVFDSYGAGNGGYRENKLACFSSQELCEELKKRVEVRGTEILGDFADWIAFYRNAELLAEVSKVEDVT